MKQIPSKEQNHTEKEPILSLFAFALFAYLPQTSLKWSRESWQGARGQGFAGRVNVGHSTTSSGQQQSGEGAQQCPTETIPCTPGLDQT